MTRIDDPFASSKQPSLFPMTIPCPKISEADYHLFYHHERRLFTLLLIILRREAIQSILVMGFLLWLERERYTSRNLVQSVLDSLWVGTINKVADEVVICLKFLEKGGNKLLCEGSSNEYDISLIQNLLNRKKICLKEFYENRDQILEEVSSTANDLYIKAFKDIIQMYIECRRQSTLIPPTEVIARAGVGGYPYPYPLSPLPSYDGNNNNLGFDSKSGVSTHHDTTLVSPIIDFGSYKGTTLNGTSITKEQEHMIPPDDRTVFLTFSKGYPITETEVRDYFTRCFGDFIEAIYMQDVGPEDQPLYARIIASSQSMVNVIIERDGGFGKSKYNINGKHVWARRYVRKKTTQGLTSVSFS